jgi:hypothetical protein
MTTSQQPFHPAVSHEEIAKRAYDIWLACGRPSGCEDEHWLRAERELAKDRSQADEFRCGLGNRKRT